MSFQVKGGVKTRYEFFDPGKHWCKLCNTVYDTALQFLEHTHFRHNKKVEAGNSPIKLVLYSSLLGLSARCCLIGTLLFVCFDISVDLTVFIE